MNEYHGHQAAYMFGMGIASGSQLTITCKVTTAAGVTTPLRVNTTPTLQDYSSFCSFKSTISSFILSTINSAVFLSNILNASENILSTSPGLSKYPLISWRTDSRSGNVSTSLSLFIFSETNSSLY